MIAINSNNNLQCNKFAFFSLGKLIRPLFIHIIYPKVSRHHPCCAPPFSNTCCVVESAPRPTTLSPLCPATSRATAPRPLAPRLVLDVLFLVSDVPRDILLPLLILCVVRRNNNYLSIGNTLSQEADALASFGQRSTVVFPSYAAMLAVLYDLGTP